MGAQVTPRSDAVRAAFRRRSSLVLTTAVAVVAALVALTACSTGASPVKTRSSGVSDNTPSGGPSPAAPSGNSQSPSQDGHPLATITATPSGRGVNPVAPVTVSVAGGTLTSVVMRNGSGKRVTGALAAGNTSWHTTEVLGYGKTYTISASAANAAGTPSHKTSTFSTLTPSNMTMPYLQRIGGYTLTKGATYGVGIVPIVHFDEPITHEAAAERALTVTTTPHVDGSWYWADDQNVHWRPRTFWPSGTKVTVTANVYGVKLGKGLYGQSDVSTSFRIGRKQVTVVRDTAPTSVNKVRVYNAAGKRLRTMNTSMGEHTGVTVNGQYINFYTLDGTYTVLEHDNPAIMSSASYGLPANSTYGYAPEAIYWSTKISVDGIYLHELDSTVWYQDHGQDVSHGCLNLNHDNAVWYYKHSIIGDPVIIHGAKGAPKLQLWEGGDWSVPWKKWLAGSALS